jgi:hypothetical protein
MIPTPPHFGLMNPEDQETYKVLQEKLLQAAEGRTRGLRVCRLYDELEEIRLFAQRGDDDDWRRCCVCGVCFLRCGIGINSHQLRYLINRCKSSINGAFKLMGYVVISARGDTNPELVDALPNLRGNTHELRQWSVRTALNYTPATFGLEKTRTPVQKPTETSDSPKTEDVREYAADLATSFQSVWEAFDWKSIPAADSGDEYFFLPF